LSRLLKLFQAGDPIVRQPARRLMPRELQSRDIQSLIELMQATMRDAHGLGLAAPQVGEPLQIVVVEDKCDDGLEPERLKELERQPVPFQVLVNPEIVDVSADQRIHIESCLSVDGYGALVPRPAAVRVIASNETGEPVSIRADGHFARVLDHEIDHLSGILYIDKMLTRSFVSQTAIERRWLSAPTSEMMTTFGIP